MGCSMPGSSVLHCLPEFASIHIYGLCSACDATRPSHPLLCPFLLPSVFPSILSFPGSQLSASGGPRIGASARGGMRSRKNQWTQDWRFGRQWGGCHQRAASLGGPEPHCLPVTSASSEPCSSLLLLKREHQTMGEAQVMFVPVPSWRCCFRVSWVMGPLSQPGSLFILSVTRPVCLEYFSQ